MQVTKNIKIPATMLLNKLPHPKTDASMIITGKRTAAAKTQTISETVLDFISCRQAIAKKGKNRRILKTEMTGKKPAEMFASHTGLMK